MVKKYDGKIPKSGKQVFEFAGFVFCHRNIKGDGSDYLISHPDGWIIGAFPRGTDRSVVLDKLAARFDLVKEFLHDPDGHNSRLATSASEQTEGIEVQEQEDRQDGKPDVLPSDIREVQECPTSVDQPEVELPYYSRGCGGICIVPVSDAKLVEQERKRFEPW